MSSGSPQGASTDALVAHGPPYPPLGAILGGLPTTNIDIPVSAVLLALFLGSAVVHMSIFRHNLKVHRRRFVLSVVLFAFSKARVVALAMRIVWAAHDANVRITIAANVLTAAGVVILFVVNLLFAHRIAVGMLVRSYPRVVRPASLAVAFFLFAVGAMLVAVVTSTVYSFYTLDPTARRQCRTTQLVAATFLAVLAFVPVLAIAAVSAVPRPNGTRAFGSGFGHGKSGGTVTTPMPVKMLIVGSASVLLTLGAAFRAGVAYEGRPIPAWFHSRACYYCFNFLIELCVVYGYAIVRVDRLFFVRNWRTAEGGGGGGGGGGEDGGADQTIEEEKPAQERNPA